MFVITLTYKVSLELVDKHIPAHVEWLKKHYEAGMLLATGPRVPRTGGVILARPVPREQIDEFIAGDPFRVHGIADYDVVEFAPSSVAPGLELLKDAA
ncbi:MAG TPA: YciI family protein [Actinocrinis sp.]|uniref:YciI family protein n=1 Tax=Actinocrinis sp. TaxID=1920516 RepID=UPI002D4F88AD|nr:YciI family protein [Actinocrinis sp.]HZU55542.1 YciI family protein [Actinocrinis sp.]